MWTQQVDSCKSQSLILILYQHVSGQADLFSLTVTDPATRETVSSRIANAGQSDLDKAVAVAEAASRADSPWSMMSAMQRSQIIWKAAELIEEEAHMLSLLESKSFGRPYSLHRAIDIKVAADNLRCMSPRIHLMKPARADSPNPQTSLAGVIRSPVTTNFETKE
jgi:acyl-CoA reductase-like NAD-dependent aldehyde dehydrogenase